MVPFWFISPPKSVDKCFFYQVKIGLNISIANTTKKLYLGELNAQESETCLFQFLYEINAKNIVKQTTCYKDLRNSSCSDQIFQMRQQYYTQHYLIFIKWLLKF